MGAMNTHRPVAGTPNAISVRILLADDHEIVRGGLRSLIEIQPGWEVCGEAATGGESVAQAAKLEPDIVIMDIGMPDLNGLDASARSSGCFPRPKC